MSRKQFDGKLFDGRKDENYEEDCKSYFLGLPTVNLPFNCINLRVLPDDVKLIHTYNKPTVYESGTLICLRNVRGGLDRKCGIDSELKMDSNGNLVFECSNEEGLRTFTVKLVNFDGIK